MECLNCHKEILKDAKFCPYCGQQVDNNNLQLKVLIKSFFENYISFDTRFGRTIWPFLFKPGYLTLKFNTGIRKNYANPFRLYILTSILFFTSVSYYSINAEESTKPPIENEELKESLAKLDPKSQKEIAQLINLEDNDSIKNSASNSEGEIVDTVPLEDIDTLVEKLKKKSSSGFKVSTNNQGFNINFGDQSFDPIFDYRYNRNFTDEQLLDSLHRENLSSFDRFTAIQSIRLWRADSDSIKKFIIKNMSFAMFLLVPLFALFLMLFYRKNKLLYVEHLIHSIHLHAFWFFLFSIVFGILLLFNGNEAIQSGIRALTLILVLIYFMVSSKKVYNRKWISVFFKSVFFGFIYSIFFTVAILVEVIISFFIF